MPVFEIFSADLVQTPLHKDDEGSLYVEMEMDGEEITRIHANVPVELYERWMASGFDSRLYEQQILNAYAFRDEDDLDEDEDNEE